MAKLSSLIDGLVSGEYDEVRVPEDLPLGLEMRLSCDHGTVCHRKIGGAPWEQSSLRQDDFQRDDWEPVVKLKDCPFCGSSSCPNVYMPSPDRPYCYCGRCGARGGSYGKDTEAIKAWNRRAGDG